MEHYRGDYFAALRFGLPDQGYVGRILWPENDHKCSDMFFIFFLVFFSNLIFGLSSHINSYCLSVLPVDQN